MYKPPEGRKLALYFYPMKDGTSGNPTGERGNGGLRSEGWQLHGAGARGLWHPAREVSDRRG